jgi:RsiW-degrading membrane proteinase PrsW (M82 family)
MVVELMVIVIIVMAVAFIFSSLPGSVEALQNYLQHLTDQGGSDKAILSQLARSPWVIIILGSIMVVLAPMVEEGLKGIGVLLLGYRQPSKAQAFIWGVAGGAGFAFVESALNSMVGFQTWGFTIALRACTAVIHTAGGGLTGLGGHALIVGRRKGRFLGFYALAVAIHGLWNAGALGLSLLSVSQQGSSLDDLTQLAITGVGSVICLALISAVGIGAASILIYNTVRFYRSAKAAQAAASLSTAPTSPDILA